MFQKLIFSTLQVQNALSLNFWKRQWIDLGVLKEVCIARPDNCWATGAALTFWMRVTYRESWKRGAISSIAASASTGFQFAVQRFTPHHPTYLTYVMLHIKQRYKTWSDVSINKMNLTFVYKIGIKESAKNSYLQQELKSQLAITGLEV